MTKQINEEQEKVNLLKEMDGQEVWTNAFGDRFEERVCVGVEYPHCWNNGEKFTPTEKEIKDLWDDYIYNELGDIKQITKEFEEEYKERK